MAAAKAFRGTVFLRMNFGSLICLWPAAIWAEITAVGITTIAANPGTGIGTTSGIAKNISEVPKELSPIESTIFSTVKSVTFGLFAKRSRRICEVRVFAGREHLLAGSYEFRSGSLFAAAGGSLPHGCFLYRLAASGQSSWFWCRARQEYCG